MYFVFFFFYLIHFLLFGYKLASFIERAETCRCRRSHPINGRSDGSSSSSSDSGSGNQHHKQYKMGTTHTHTFKCSPTLAQLSARTQTKLVEQLEVFQHTGSIVCVRAAQLVTRTQTAAVPLTHTQYCCAHAPCWAESLCRGNCCSYAHAV